MIEIRLPRGIWQYDPEAPIGRLGGFGKVFAGSGEGLDKIAVKRLYITASEAAHRELRMAEVLVQRQLTHVIPVLDAGQDAQSDFYFVIMPRADMSLQDELDRVGVFSESEAVSILSQITVGLQEVQDIVHRDLKPANILYHDGRWKIADFGIARFVEGSTSLNTLKDFWTSAYAAPEQWQLKHATHATDIYALGCIAYALLTGHPPFAGPKREDFREQHLLMEPPILVDIQPRIRGLITMMLRKSPEGRPSLERIIHLLEEITKDSAKADHSEGFQAIARAGADQAEASARADADLMAEAEELRERQSIANNAIHILGELSNTFYKKLQDSAPAIVRHERRSTLDLLNARLGSASIHIEIINGGNLIHKSFFQHSGWDVIVGAMIYVSQGAPQYLWGANLWYTNLGSGSEYRWWEVPYFKNYFSRDQRLPDEPHAVIDFNVADIAASPVMGDISLAAKPRAIDDEDADDFCDRWADILAQAYNGRLERPRNLPLS